MSWIRSDAFFCNTDDSHPAGLVARLAIDNVFRCCVFGVVYITSVVLSRQPGPSTGRIEM